jgi:UDP-N-acetylglucosamine 2-epimerase (non-hydrolysing)
MRDTTERPEILISGLVKLVGSDKNKIIDEVTILLTNNKAYDKMASAVNPYGNGATSRLILEYLNSVFKA